MRYAPVDWLYSRPHGRLIGRNDQGKLIKETSPFMRPGRPGDLGIAILSYGASQEGRRLMDDIYQESEFNILKWEVMVADALLKFSMAGRNVFTFDDDMTDNLAEIAMDEVIAEDLLLPYKSFYLSFGDKLAPLPDGTPIDGVLVWSVPAALFGENQINPEVLAKVTVLSNELEAKGILPGDPRFDTALEAAVEEWSPARLLNIMFMPKPTEGSWTERREVGRYYQIDLEPHLPLIEAFSAEQIGSDEMEFCAPLPDLKERLKLVLNAILYIGRYAEDRSPRWHNGPSELVHEANAGKRSAQRELAKQGFITTRLIGYGNHEDYGDAPGEAGGRAPHWRRAHWRNQAHGPQHSQRKLLLIRESKVGFTKDAKPDHQARIYKA